MKGQHRNRQIDNQHRQPANRVVPVKKQANEYEAQLFEVWEFTRRRKPLMVISPAGDHVLPVEELEDTGHAADLFLQIRVLICQRMQKLGCHFYSPFIEPAIDSEN